MSDQQSPGTTEPERRWRFSEDWAATVVGLVLLILILTGVITKGVLQ